MAYGDFKDLTWGTACDKILRHKAFNIAKNPKSNGHQWSLSSMVIILLIKSSGIKNEIIFNKALAEELHK